MRDQQKRGKLIFLLFCSLQTVRNRKKTTAPIEQSLPQVDLKGHTVEELAAVANVSVAAIKRAIEIRQKQLVAEQEEIMQKKMLEEELKRDEMIAKRVAMYQQEHQRFLATSTTSSTTTTTTTTTSTTPQPTTTSRQAIPTKSSGKVTPPVLQSKVGSLRL